MSMHNPQSPSADLLDLSPEELTHTNGGDLDFGGGLPHICSGIGCVIKHIVGSGRDDIVAPPSY